MCLSTVYEVGPGGREKVCEYVSAVRAEDGKVILTDIMGLETVVYGAMTSVDLVKNEIVIEGTKQ